MQLCANDLRSRLRERSAACDPSCRARCWSFIEAVQETAPTELSGRLRALAKLDSLISSMGSRVMPHCIGACGPRRSRMGDQPVTTCHRADASGSARNRRSRSRSESAHSSSAGCRAKATLREPSVSRFLRRVEKIKIRHGCRGSISTIIDNGYRLYDTIQNAAAANQSNGSDFLRDVIDPIVVPCGTDDRCPITGLRLLDVWRYFRHTWSLEYRSIPGRKLPLLIRNRAHPTLPVIGIGLIMRAAGAAAARLWKLKQDLYART